MPMLRLSLAKTGGKQLAGDLRKSIRPLIKKERRSFGAALFLFLITGSASG
jgi:hypothetical protein